MKKPIIIYFLLVLTCISCVDSTEKYQKNIKNLLGEWQLNQMTYTNETGKLIDVEQIASSIKFSDVFTTQADGNMTKKGMLYVGNDSVYFEYEFDFYSNRITIHVDRELIKDMPISTFGKVNMYDFELIDKKELIFTVDAEYVYPSNEILTSPVYVFVR